MIYREGDPVYVSVPEYDGTGVVVMALAGEGLLIQVRERDPRHQHRSVVVKEDLVEYAVRPYNRPACQYCGSLRMVIDGLPAGRIRWDCCDCMGRQDT